MKLVLLRTPVINISLFQVVPAVYGNNVRNDVSQQLDNAELSQQIEEFGPLQQTGQQVDDTDVSQSQTGNFLLTQNHQQRDNRVTHDVFGNSHTQQEIQDNVDQGIDALNVALSQNHQPGVPTGNKIHLLPAQSENNQRVSYIPTKLK